MGISEEIKSTKFENNKVKAIVNLLYTSNWYRDIHKAFIKEYNLQHQHYNVLRIIFGKHPNPISPGQIKEVMLDKGPDVTRLVDKLVKMDLVTRCPGEDNRRAVEIRINSKGQEILKKMNVKIRAVTDLHFGLSEKEAGILSDLLDKARVK